MVLLLHGNELLVGSWKPRPKRLFSGFGEVVR